MSTTRSEASSDRRNLVRTCVEHSAAMAAAGRSSPRARLQANLERIEAGRFDEAIADLGKMLDTARAPAGYLLLAEAYLRRGETQAALATLDTLAYVEPGFVEGTLMRGLVLLEHGTPAEARVALHAVVQARPSFALGWKALILMALEQGSHHEAARLLAQALPHHHNLRSLIHSQNWLWEEPVDDGFRGTRPPRHEPAMYR